MRDNAPTDEHTYDRSTDLQRRERHIVGSSPRTPSRGQAGTSGTPGGGSINPNEKNPELTGAAWARTARIMQTTDPKVAEVWGARKQTMLSADWRWVSADEGDAFCDMLRDWMADSWAMMRTPWEEQLAYLSEFVPVGYRFPEEVYITRPTGRSGEPQWHLDVYADREPDSLNQWIRDPLSGDLIGVSQSIGLSRRTPEPIPASKLLLLTRGRTGQNYAGFGLCRPMWFWHDLKTKTATSLGISMDRYAVPPLVVDLNREAGRDAGYDESTMDSMAADAKAEALKFLAAQQAYLVKNAFVSFEQFGASYVATNAAAAVVETIKQCDLQISNAGLTQFLQLGVTDSGSRGVAETMETFFRRAVENDLDVIANTINGPARPGGGTVGRILGFNFGAVPSDKLPRLVHDGLNVDPLVVMAQQLPALVNAGLVNFTDEDENRLRNHIGFGEIDEANKRTPEERSAATNPLGAVAAFRERAKRNG